MLEVLDPGTLTTVQDGGRVGWARYGVPPSGAMDIAALVAANRLVGNLPQTAALEVTLDGPVLRAWSDCLIAVCGADFELWVGRLSVPCWHSLFVRAGYLIRFGRRLRGARAYLAVAGGIEVPPFLGSRSTYLRGGFGGFEGRALQRGDRLTIGTDPSGRRGHQFYADAGAMWPGDRRPPYTSTPVVRVIPGPQEDAFAEATWARFVSAPYEISPASDRMGIRLQGPPLVRARTTDMISDGLVTGSIQVPPDGQPILMMADHQTTGGYPKIATAIQADLPLLAQCLPGDIIRFQEVGLADARAATRAFRRGLWR
ncbi:MAG: biotin-dependent carboxyltransferase family protein [Anaerolineae bacterium]